MTDWGPKGAERSDTPRFCKPAQPKKLGQGAFKRVYRAYDCIEGSEVAWSEIGIGHLSGSDRGKILREVKMMKQLKHENLIELIDQWFDTEDNKVVIITAMGVPLRKFVERWSGAIELSLVRKWARQVLRGLSYIHSRGVVHRDMKMENLLLVKGRIVITDYGLARELASAADKRMTSYIGTPAFMAPELYEDEGYDSKVDVYAFGMVLLEMITAEMPYGECGGAPAKIMFKVMNGAKPSALRKIRCVAARNLIEVCLSKDPNHRPSAAELLEHHNFFHVTDEYLHQASRPFSKAVESPATPPGAQSDADSVGTADLAADSQGTGATTSTATADASSPVATKSKARGWLPPVLVYDPLQVELRLQLKQEQEQQRQDRLMQQGENSTAGSEPIVDNGDDLGPELNQRYDAKIEEASILADTIMKDFHTRVDEFSRSVKDRATPGTLRELFKELPHADDKEADAALIRDNVPASIRDAWPGSEDQFVSVMLAARDYVNAVPMKLSDAVHSAVNRNAKVCKAHMRTWCVQRALRAVARTMAGEQNGSRSNANGRRISCAGDGNENGRGMGSRNNSANSASASGWNTVMHTLPYNGNAPAAASATEGSATRADAQPAQSAQSSQPAQATQGTQEHGLTQRNVAAHSAQTAGHADGIGLSSNDKTMGTMPRARANTGGTVGTSGTDSIVDHDDVFASVDGGRAAARAAMLEERGRAGATSNRPEHSALNIQNTSGALPPRPRSNSQNVRTPKNNIHRSTSDSSQSSKEGDSSTSTTGGALPVMGDGQLQNPKVANHKDNDPFGFVNANIFGTKVKTTTVAPGERSPAMMLDAGVIAAISPSGKIQVDGQGHQSSALDGHGSDPSTVHGPVSSPQLIEFSPESSRPPLRCVCSHGFVLQSSCICFNIFARPHFCRAHQVMEADRHGVVSDSELPMSGSRHDFNDGHESDPGHMHSTDPFGHLFADTPVRPERPNPQNDSDSTLPDVTIDDTVMVVDISQPDRIDELDKEDGDDGTSESSNYDADDIFELNVEEAARRLKLE